MTIRKLIISVLSLPMLWVSCTPEDLMPTGNPASRDDGDVPSFVTGIKPYDGELADDAANDVIGSSLYYWEKNGNNGSDFRVKVAIEYQGDAATVVCENSTVTWNFVSGTQTHVVLDMSQCSSPAEVTVSGQSADGSLKIYGKQPIKLTLAGVDLTSSRGPAINNQDKKTCFVHLTEGTTNRLTDAVEYAADVADNADEDSKGCFFSEGNLIFSGTGALVVQGRQRHGIAVDGFFYVRPGVTIAVTDAAKNAIHAKGDSGFGVAVYGGLIYAHVSAAAGKCIKSDLPINIRGGKLDLNTSGAARFDTTEEDTSSPACLKSDGNITILNGTVSVKSSGNGGKGINATGDITISGGTVTVATTGKRYVFNETLTSSPKGIKADGKITVSGGTVKVAATGTAGGSEGIDSKSTLSIKGGEVYVYATDDAITAVSLAVTGGRTYAYSVRNDGIVSEGSISVADGLVIASGSTSVADKKSFYCRSGEGFDISGGTLLGIGGTVTLPSAGSSQSSVLCRGWQVSKNETVALLDASGNMISAYTVPRTMEGASFFFSAPALVSGTTCTIYRGGRVSDVADSWYGWYSGGSWSGGTQVGRFACNGGLSVIGN